MKILVIHHCDAWGGAGITLSTFCEMLMRDHDITVLLGHADTEVANELGKLPIRIKSMGTDMAMISAYNGGPKFLSRTFFRNLFQIPKCKKHIKKLLSEDKFDLVVLNSMVLSWACEVVAEKNIPSCVYVQETMPHNHLGFKLIEWEIKKYSSAVFYISEHDKKTMHFHVKSDVGVNLPYLILYNSIDFNRFKVEDSKESLRLKYGIENEKMVALFVGGNDPLKGYDVLLESLDKLNGKDFQLIVAGNVPEEKKREGVLYLGKVFDMPPVYKMADVLVFPSIAGHQARPAFEAGAFHVPVIISDFPATSDEVVNGMNGLTFQPRNSYQLTECITYMLEHPEDRKRMGENNYIRAENFHDFEYNNQRLLSFLTQFKD